MPEPRVTCPSCAAEVAAAKFCSECGAALAAAAPPAPQAPPARPLLPPPPPPLIPGQAAPPGSTGTGLSRQALAMIGGGALALLVVVAVVIGVSSSKHTIHGTMTLFDLDSDFEDSVGCSGSGGYDDIHEGAPVVVKDEDDKVIATAELEDSDGTGGLCTFTFVVEDVPNAEFYSVGAGNDSRGGVRFSKKEMEENDWEVGLSLGD